MKRTQLEIERKFASGFLILVAVAAISWITISQIELHRSVESAARVGIISEIDQDPFQRDVRIAFALMFGAISVWSRKAVKVALIAFALVYFILEILIWLAGPHDNPFDMTEPEVHLAGGIILLIATLSWIRKVDHLLISALAPIYILFEYTAWYFRTGWFRRSREEMEFNTPLWLNYLFYGIEWWHIIILLMAILMIVWQIRMLLKEKSTGRLR